MGYGAVVPDGYGVSYNPYPDRQAYFMSILRGWEFWSYDDYDEGISDLDKITKDKMTVEEMSSVQMTRHQ